MRRKLFILFILMFTSVVYSTDIKDKYQKLNKTAEFTELGGIAIDDNSYIIRSWENSSWIRELSKDDMKIDSNNYVFFEDSGEKYIVICGGNFFCIFDYDNPNLFRMLKNETKSEKKYAFMRFIKFDKIALLENFNRNKNTRLSFGINKILSSSNYTEKTRTQDIIYDSEYLSVLFDMKFVYTDWISHTPWVPGKENNSSGIDEYLEIEFTEPKDNIVVLNGYVDLEKRYLYKANNRVKTAIITSLDEENPFEIEYEFEDYVHFSEIDFPCEVSKVRFTIKEVYKGEKWDDTCITAVITRWEEDSKKEKHVGGGGGYAFDDEGNILK